MRTHLLSVILSEAKDLLLPTVPQMFIEEKQAPRELKLARDDKE